MPLPTPVRPLRRSDAPRRGWVVAAVVAAVVGLVGVTAGPGAEVGGRDTAAAAVAPYAITVAQTSDLTDGTPVPLTVTSSDPTVDPVGWVDVRLCRPGIAYTSYAVVETRGNCGYSPGSSAYTSPTGSATQDFPGEPSGKISFPDRFVAGVGSASFAGSNLTCAVKDPCDLVVSVFTSQTQFEGTTAQEVRAFPLTYLPFDGLAGCNGTATAALQTVSSDRLVDAYTDWSRQACSTKGPGGGKAPTQNTFVDEGGAFGAVDSFAQGDADMAYAAGGYDLPGFSEPTGRPYVAVPVALNAVVVAASGGQEVAAYTPKGSAPVTEPAPFSSLRLTADQAASIFGGGHVSTGEASAIDRQNPELDPDAAIVPYTPPGGSSFIYPQAIAGVDATTVFASTYFTDIATHDWNSGPYAASGHPVDVHRSVFSSFAQPGAHEPAFDSLGLYSHRTDLERSALPYVGVGPLPLWVLTDRATATELGFAVASLGEKGRGFTASSAATMDAAVGDMTVSPDGTLVPNPKRVEASKRRAYPLTFVEYALVPTEPLVTASCAPRTASEKLMIQWVKFLTGRGQHGLAPGLEPLTPALRRKAAVLIARIGRSAPTGACAAKTPSTTVAPPPTTGGGGSTPPTTVASTPPVTTVTTGHHDRRPATTRRSTSATSTTTVTLTSPTSAPARRLAAVRIPPFAGHRHTDWLLPSAALVLIGLLTGGVARRTSGHDAPHRIGGWPGRRRARHRRRSAP